MFRSYLTIALRNLARSKAFSIINILGLALGLAASMLILLWVRDEWSYDRFHQHSGQLYKVYGAAFVEGKIDGSYGTPPLLYGELKRRIPDIVAATPHSWNEQHTFQVGDKIFKESGAHAGPDFFRMFSFPLLEGTAGDALNSPESIAISRKMAVHFFGSPEAAIGKTIRYENTKDLVVKAVYEDMPVRTMFQDDFVLNWETFLDENNGWARDITNFGPETFIMLRPDAHPAAVDAKLLHFMDPYLDKKAIPMTMGMQPLRDVYLHGQFEAGKPAGGRIAYVHLFSLVAAFILLIACINFMNLTTARSVRRMKEIGVRKVIGAVRGALIRQFMGEAILIALLSGGVAFLLVVLTLPAFNELTRKQVSLPYQHVLFWTALVGMILLTGIVSGSYPALVLSKFQPIKVLKGASPGGTWLRKTLVVFQFTLSIVLIIATILVSRQIRFLEQTNLGYDRENLVYIPLEGNLKTKLKLFQQEAQEIPGVIAMTGMSNDPTNIANGTSGLKWTGKDPDAKIQFSWASVGYDFVSTLRLQMRYGRDFDKSLPSDSTGYIINEAALAKIGYKDPIGQPLTFWRKPGRIIGVVRDFHFQSLHEPIKPMVIHLDTLSQLTVALIRIRAGQTGDAIKGLERLCKSLNPAFPFNYRFSDEEYVRQYRSEEVVGHLALGFAALAIFISCLGLLGLSVFTAQQRMKEISIRKVLGAGLFNLFALLTKDFLLLVVIAFLIAAPVAWWAIHRWLEQFSYRTEVSWWIFALAGILALLIALVTISYQTLRAAAARPAQRLRTE
ncbi:ABC transporter permease [Dinghuibacter silviterrae]|uniref:FtsX-like permease family protein n=1 Tax=Dinghuibacter silviterrae TaxID=1539049 RepID=A0A4R8DG33_9BACT|nr:ABC transporter permease [Dinghuibacter silviterrae]TDW96581.1 FtsX-like permease family protein [Dinghuibacter silviterrae]